MRRVNNFFLLNDYERGRKMFFFLEKTKRKIKVAERGIQLTTLSRLSFNFSDLPVRTRDLRATVLTSLATRFFTINTNPSRRPKFR